VGTISAKGRVKKNIRDVQRGGNDQYRRLCEKEIGALIEGSDPRTIESRQKIRGRRKRLMKVSHT